MAGSDELDQFERRAKIRRWLGWGLGGAALIGGGLLADHLFIRAYRPAGVCSHYADIASDGDYRELVAPETGLAADPRASFEKQCRWYFEGIRAKTSWQSFGDLGACVLGAEERHEIARCLTLHRSNGEAALEEKLAAAFAEAPTRVPDMPSVLEPAYESLVEIADAAIAECPSLYVPGRGCYAYVLPFQADKDKDLGHAIPGPRPPKDTNLVGLEVDCDFDIAAVGSSRPEMLEATRDLPMPAHAIGCNFLPEGTLSLPNCSGKASRSGGRDNVSIAAPADPSRWGADPDECTSDLFFIELRRTRGDGITVEVKATFRP